MKYKLIPKISIISILLLITTSCESPTNETPDAAEEPSFSSTDLYQTADTVIAISTSTAGATINYTIDGTDPVNSPTVITGETGTSTTSFTITADMTVKAIAIVEGAEPSETTIAMYEKILFYNGFNMGTLGNWTDNPDVDTAVSIDSALGADSTMGSLKLDNTEYFSKNDPFLFSEIGAVRSYFSEGIAPSYISFYMRFKESLVANKTLSLIFWNSDTEVLDNNRILTFRLNGGFLNEQLNSVSSASTLSPETWYHIELKNIVFTDGILEGVCALYLDGTIIANLVLGNGGGELGIDAIRAITLDNQVGEIDPDRISWFDELLIK